MSDEISQHENTDGQTGYEHTDAESSGILNFLFGVAVLTLICVFALRGVYAFLDRREKTLQPPVNPLITSIPADTRHIAPGYPQGAFPNPKLEEDERGQLNGIRLEEEKKLYSYGWVDEKAGTLHIPIERAMDLLAQRGLPVRQQGMSGVDAAAAVSKKGGKK